MKREVFIVMLAILLNALLYFFYSVELKPISVNAPTTRVVPGDGMENWAVKGKISAEKPWLQSLG